MKTFNTKVLIPALSSAGSFFVLLGLMMFTSPFNNIAVAVFFFVALLVFLISFGSTITILQTGRVSRKARGRIAAVTTFILVLFMFRSTGSLSWVDGIVLILIVSGLVFYGSRRS